MSIDALRELSQKLAADPEAVNSLTDEEVIGLRKYLNPFGNVVTGKKSYINLSIINWKEEYLKRLHMTALAGYLYRLAEEYEPEDEINAADRKLKAAMNAKPEAADELKAEHAEYVKLLTSTTRNIVRKFMDRGFEFNPDRHLRAAGKTTDKEEILKQCRVDGAAVDKKLEGNANLYPYMRSNVLAMYQQTIAASQILNAAVNTLADDSLDRADQCGIVYKKYVQLNELAQDMKKIAEPLALADTVEAWTANPPVDTFHNFNRYLSNHYEQLRAVCAAKYNENPDFEYSVIYYDQFKSLDAAREYKIQHEAEFKAEVLTIENSGITMIGPFKENRDRVDFYNKNTEIMKRMSEQMETDHKLGRDLMEKHLKDKKKKNIAECGPDAPGLEQYAKVGNTVRELGAKKGLTKEEQEEYVQALRAKEDMEVPDDGIQCDMFFPETVDGETRLKRSIFYTQAEAPLHLQENSEFHEKYQPVRSGPLDKSIVEKTVVNRHGQKCSVKSLRKESS